MKKIQNHLIRSYCYRINRITSCYKNIYEYNTRIKCLYFRSIRFKQYHNMNIKYDK